MRPWPHAQFLEEVKTMAYIISDDCISCGACEAECLSALFRRVTASIRLILKPVLNAALAREYVP